MGRPKSYDRTEVLERALRLFWERGYHATSTRELAEAMGLNPFSLYAEFGSKEALYEAAIARYDERVVTRHFGPLEAPGASLEEVRAVIRFFGAAGAYENATLGCLLCNAATELAPTEAISRDQTGRYVARLKASFEHALGGAEAAGRLVHGAPVEELAAFFTTTLLGMFVLMRAGGQGALLKAAEAQALARLEAYSKSG